MFRFVWTNILYDVPGTLKGSKKTTFPGMQTSCRQYSYRTLDNTSYQMNSERWSSFSKLQDCARAAIRQLQLKDFHAVSALYKLTGTKVFNRKRVRTLRVIENQIIVYLIGEQTPREDVEHLNEIMGMLPSTSGVPPKPGTSGE